MKEFTIGGYEVSSWIIIPVIFLIWVIVLFAVKRGVFAAISALAKKTKTSFDDVLVGALDLPLNLLIFTSGGAVVERFLPLAVEGNGELTGYLLIAFKATAIVAVIIFVDRFLTELLSIYSPRVEILRSSGGLARGVVRAVVIGLGILILLDSFGVSITPIIASLGIGSLAVALALQPTLENFFSGIQLILDKPISVGHFIKLESGEEGYVHKIGWRSTWVRMLPNNIVVIPNKSIVDSKIINYYYPDRELAVLVEVGVHYGSDLQNVERVTIAVAKEVQQQVSGAVKEFEPFIRYHTFDSSSVNFTVILRAREFVDNYLVKHEFIKRLHARYKQEGITIPYPIRAVNFEQEQSMASEDFLSRIGRRG